MYQWISGKPNLAAFPKAQALEDFKVTLQQTNHYFGERFAFVKDEIVEDIQDALQNPQFITKATLQTFKNRLFSAEKDFATLSVKAFDAVLLPDNISFEGKALSEFSGFFFHAIENVTCLYLP